MNSRPRVEIRGLTARYYDSLMNAATLGRYPLFLQKVISLMKIKPENKIIDLGAGTGRNACLMLDRLSLKGELVGFDISEEMIDQFNKRCSVFPNATLVTGRIEQDLGYKMHFDKAFISFVLHGFPQDKRKNIIQNTYEALKKDGEFFILDYNEFKLKETPFYFKIPFKLIECPYAFDFIEKDWKNILADEGFEYFEEYLFFKGYIRLLKAKKKS